ncbi:MAG TPA: hypothetical protein P5320_07745 [Bacteroidales bacterium]|nr:hypothetical protein [Bacteroidales bacterium]HOK75059.1 hypothetical protein [Bacteroidales bacterium]HOM41333.1 hypothetical protein [Bacteroidales bacterium]HOU30683.1 hypothetical protein [Bacteroidales bacterium]HPP93106.1 hypothetical protein [Bacteroidales bacterium]
MADLKKNPFPGLRAFREDEHNLFFGREGECREIIDKLLKNRFVAVIGNAGSGKTSILQADVIPALKKGVTTAGNWRIILMTPGINPLGNLADSIAREVAPNKSNYEALRISIADVLKSNQDGLNRIVNDLIIKKDEHVLIVVDQFEELFRYGKKALGPYTGNGATAFVNLLMNAVEQQGKKIFLIVAISSEYIPECTRFYRFTQSIIINRSSVIISEIPAEGLAPIIENPVKTSGAYIDPVLIQKITGEVSDRVIPVALVQHALTRTWDNWQIKGKPQEPLNVSDFEKAGGLDKSVDIHGEEIFAELGTREKTVCELLFKTITGKGSGNERIRKPSSAGLIKAVTGCSADELKAVLEAFACDKAGFIKYTGTSTVNDDSIIDVTYDCLLNSWARLKQWIDEEAESASTYLRLSEMATLYHEGKTGLLKPPELFTYLNWREKQKPSLQWAMQYDPGYEKAISYLNSSETSYIEEEEKKKKKQKKKSIWRRLFILSLGTILITLAGITLVMISRTESQRKATEAAELEKRKADSVALTLLNEKYRSDSVISLARVREQEIIARKEYAERQRIRTAIAASEALKKVERARSVADSLLRESLLAKQSEEEAIAQRNEAIRLRMVSTGKSMAIRSLQIQEQKDLQILLAYQGYKFNKKFKGFPNDPDIYAGLYNIAKKYGNKYYKVLSGHGGAVKSIALVPGKREFYTAGADGKVLRWNLENTTPAMRVIYSGSELIEVISLSPGADRLALGLDNSVIRVISLNGNKEPSFDLKGHAGKIQSLIFSYDGRYLYSAALDGRVLKWDLALKTSVDLETGNVQITSIDISSGGNYLAGVSSDGKALVWNTELSTGVLRLENPGKSIKIIRFKPGENIIAAGYSDGTLEMWNIEEKKKIHEIKAHEGEINQIRFNSVFSLLATASSDKTLKIWDLSDVKALPLTFSDNNGVVMAVEFSNDGSLIITGIDASENNIIVRPSTADLLAEDICQKLTRNFTEDEWYNYVGKDVGYEKTCSEKEFSIKVQQIRQ